MSHDPKSESLSGRLRQLLFSPKGGIEGLLLSLGSKVVQVSMDPGSVASATLAQAIGNAIEVEACADRSPKTKTSAHPVYTLRHITTLGGKNHRSKSAEEPVRGVVAAIHYAKHGEPNGVILESGEFIHTRPLGMRKLKLEVGSKVVARGERRMTVLGSPLIEAHEVNKTTLE